VGALILWRDSILLVQRGKQPMKGFWSLPGGVLETGEHLAEAVKREVREETGLDVKPVAVVEIFERILRDPKGDPEYHYVLIDYLCKVSGGDLQASDDASGAAWIKRRDLKKYRVTDGTLEVIERAFAKRSELR
jgi:ADP-ribose pyrophosphatase YjhB (NUDIX family)